MDPFLRLNIVPLQMCANAASDAVRGGLLSAFHARAEWCLLVPLWVAHSTHVLQKSHMAGLEVAMGRHENGTDQSQCGEYSIKAVLIQNA